MCVRRSCVLVLLACCLLLCAGAPVQVRIASQVPLPVSQGQWWADIYACMVMAEEEINNSTTLLPNTRFNLVVENRNEVPTLINAFKQATTDETLGLISAASSSTSISVQEVAKEFSLPQISFSATSPALSDKTRFPTFFRTIATDAVQGHAVASVVHHFGFTKVATVTLDNDYGRGVQRVFDASALALGINIVASITHFPVSGADDDLAGAAAQLAPEVRALHLSGARVVVMLSADSNTRAFLVQANASGLVGEGFTYFGIEAVMVPTLHGNEEGMLALTQGMVGTVPAVAKASQEYQGFIQRWATRDSSKMWEGHVLGTTDLGFYAAYMYDSVYAFAHGLHNLIEVELKEPTREGLLESLKYVEFNGITGRVRFDENQDRIGQFSIVNLQGTEFVDVGTFESEVIITKDIIWAGNTTTLPPADIICPRGQWLVQGLCAPCSPGWYSAVPGATVCTKCSVGHYQSLEGQSQCTQCPPGTHQDRIGQSECRECHARSYTEASGSIECESCPSYSSNFLPDLLIHLGTIDTAVLDNRTECVCEPAYYGNGVVGCRECPSNGLCCLCAESVEAQMEELRVSGKPCAQCLSGTVQPMAAAGSILSSTMNVHGQARLEGATAEDVIVTCHVPDACLGGPLNQCAPGYEGRRCGTCSSGYFRHDMQCKECLSGHNGTMAVLIILVVVLALFFVWISMLGIRLSSAIIVTNFLQVSALFSYFNLAWPSTLRTLLVVASSANFNLDIFAPECSTALGDYWTKWLLSITSPFWFGAAVLVVECLFTAGNHVAAWEPVKEDPGFCSFEMFLKNKTERRNVLINTFMMFLGVVYTVLVSKCFELFICTPNPDGTFTMANAPSFDCYTSTWQSYQPVAILGIIVFGVGIPCALFLFLRKNRLLLDTTVLLMRFGTVYKGYHRDNYYWDAVSMMRKFLLLMTTLMFQNNTSLQVVVALIVLLAYLLLEIYFMPFRFPHVNKTHTLVDIVMFLTLLSAVVLTTPTDDTTASAIAIIIVVVNILAVAIALASLVVEMRMHYRFHHEKLEAIAKLAQGIAPSPTSPNSPSSILLRNKRSSFIESRSNSLHLPKSEGKKHAEPDTPPTRAPQNLYVDPPTPLQHPHEAGKYSPASPEDFVDPFEKAPYLAGLSQDAPTPVHPKSKRVPASLKPVEPDTPSLSGAPTSLYVDPPTPLQPPEGKGGKYSPTSLQGPVDPFAISSQDPPTPPRTESTSVTVQVDTQSDISVIEKELSKLYARIEALEKTPVELAV